MVEEITTLRRIRAVTSACMLSFLARA
jgi:hypothetical protein